jgi:hypothetical protein
MGIAIGKCGNEGSKLADLDIIAGYVTASQNLSQEMVTSDEVSKYNFENLKGGAKRLILYSTWGSQINSDHGQTSIPVITTMLQVSGPEMEEYAYNKILRFIKSLNDEIIYRYMLGELTPERTIDPIIYIDILNHLINSFHYKDIQIFGESNKILEDLVEKSLKTIFSKDTKVLMKLLSRISLNSTCNQENYSREIKDTKEFIQEEIREFLEFERDMTYIRNLKIYGENNSFQNLGEDFRRYQDKQETRFMNKRALTTAIERTQILLDEIISVISTRFQEENFMVLSKLKKALPKVESCDDFISKIKQEYSQDGESGILNQITKLTNFKEKEINRALIEAECIDKDDAKQYYLKLNELKNNLESIISLIRQMINTENSEYLSKIQHKFDHAFNESVRFQNKKHNSILLNELKKGGSSSNTNGPLQVDLEYMELNNDKNIVLKDYRRYVNQKINQMRDNLIIRVIDSLYNEIFHSYRKFKYVLTYFGDIKSLIIRKITTQAKIFLKKIQKFSFPSLLDKCLKKIYTEDLIKYYAIQLIRNFLGDYLYENFIENPFSIKKRNPVIALDSYSLNFCSEIIKATGLNEEIYKTINNLSLPNNYKESFIQILDVANSKPNIILKELRNSSKIFKKWIQKINTQISEYEDYTKKYEMADFFKFLDNFIEKYKADANEDLKKGVFFIRDEILLNSKPKTKERTDLIRYYERDITYLDDILDKMEKLEDKEKIFGEKTNYDQIISYPKSLLRNYLEDDKKIIDELIESLSKLVDKEKSKKVNELISKIEDYEDYISDTNKIINLKETLKNIHNISQFRQFYQKLDKINNQFLDLPQYNHIKGMINSIINPESLIRESDIQYKYKSYNLLLEALVGIYAKIYEDYFGKFSFEDVKKILTTDLKVKIDPGEFFTKKLNMIIFHLNLVYGILYLNKLFENIEKYHSKSDFFNLKFMMNYLADYLKETNFESSEMLIQSFHLPNNFQKFVHFLANRFEDESFKKRLKSKIPKFFNKLQDYLNGGRKRRPTIPDELYLLKDKNIEILRTIAGNVSKSDRKYFLRGDHKDKNHISRDFNLEKISEKGLDSLIEDISNLEEYFKHDIQYVLNKISYDPPQYTHREKIISNMVEDVKEIIWEEIDNHTLSEYDFEDINKIRIRSILNTTHYELPIDIRMYLINEGRYDGETAKKLIESSTTVSDSFRKYIDQALLTEESYKDLLDTKLEKNGTDELYFPVNLHILKEISSENKKTIFGKNAVWNNGESQLIGFKLPIENPEIKTYAEALNMMVKNEIYDELEPLINLIDQYSKEIHTGFIKVYERIFQ